MAKKRILRVLCKHPSGDKFVEYSDGSHGWVHQGSTRRSPAPSRKKSRTREIPEEDDEEQEDEDEEQEEDRGDWW